MRIERWDPADEKAARACHDLMLAANKVDDPVEPPLSYGILSYVLQHGWENTPGETWVGYDEGGAVVAYYRMNLPDLENRDEASGDLFVHPAARRRGVGRELLRHAGGRAAANGRTRFSAGVTAGGAGQAFAEAVGARLDLQEIRRIQYLREIAPGTVATLRAAAARAATGYSLVSWTGDVPAAHRAGVAGVLNAFADAPHGQNYEPEVWDADRVAQRAGCLVRAGLLRSSNVAAVCDATGEMVAYSEIAVDPEHPAFGYQLLTAVVRSHRGHRLGLLVKTAMLELLASTEPQLELIQTGNASSNEHMIGINEQLSYKVVEPGWRFYEMPVADIG